MRRSAGRIALTGVYVLLALNAWAQGVLVSLARSNDPPALTGLQVLIGAAGAAAAWEWGGAAFTWADDEGKPVAGTTIWSIGPSHSDQFAPGTATFMVNYRVEDLYALVNVLREEGCNVLEKVDDSE